MNSRTPTNADRSATLGQVSADRYARGEELMGVVKALWDSWAADAVVDDRTDGVYARADRIRAYPTCGDWIGDHTPDPVRRG
jgi:alkanesulfonate monooxygenase SsuD/methylene tetrahydromethanopterin reductase-like flavin-dependent oxidoreductase (luciferase family)